jgi:asparagine synthase (glutamine-hydrolysing)
MLIYIQLEWLCRLSIIDLSSGKQPIKNDDGSIVIVFNGEIYNYKQLKVNLENRGVFLTKSDTEVLRLYEAYGIESFSMLDGMFAFSIHDKKQIKFSLLETFWEKTFILL